MGLKLPSVRTLSIIAGYGGLITLGTGIYLKSRLQDSVVSYTFYKRAMEQLRTYRPAVEFLGEPIKDLAVEVGDEKSNFLGETEGKLKIPLSGSKQRGNLYVFTGRSSPKMPWVVTRLELELQKEPNRRLLVFDSRKV